MNTKKLKTGLVFADAPGQMGVLWTNMCTMEDQLAGMLFGKPDAFLAIGENAWMLVEDDDEFVLTHSTFINGNFSDQSSRFDFDLEWSDVEQPDLERYNGLLVQGIRRLEELNALGFDSDFDYQNSQRIMQESRELGAKQKADSIAAGSTAFHHCPEKRDESPKL